MVQSLHDDGLPSPSVLHVFQQPRQHLLLTGVRVSPSLRNDIDGFHERILHDFFGSQALHSSRPNLKIQRTSRAVKEIGNFTMSYRPKEKEVVPVVYIGKPVRAGGSFKVEVPGPLIDDSLAIGGVCRGA